MKLSNADLELLRGESHSVRLFLSVYRPDTVLSCQLNDASASKGLREVTYNNVTQGSYLNVVSGQTLYVGTSVGAKDKGKLRVKSIDATTITVAENEHINWADDDFLTVIDFFEIQAIFPRIIKDPANQFDVIFYKDFDDPYVSQNTQLGAFVQMGPHHAGLLKNGSHDVFWCATGTVHLGGDSLSYGWTFEGGTPSTSTDVCPGNVTWNSPGYYTVALEVSGSSGSIDRSYRHVSIYDNDHMPYTGWNLENLAGSRGRGGYAGRVKIFQLAEDIQDGDLVVIFSEDYFGNTEKSIGGNFPNREKIFFVGYIRDGTVTLDYDSSQTEFEIVSPTEMMKDAEGFSVSVQHDVNPDTWFKLKNMTVRKALHHYYRWHSTAPLCMDMEYVGGSEHDRNIQYFDADRESLYEGGNRLMSGTIVGAMCADRQGKLFFEVDAYLVTGTFAIGDTLTKDDWMNEPSIEERNAPELAYLELGGIHFDPSGATGTSVALIAGAPGEVPAYRGGLERSHGLALINQSDLNRIAGELFAFRNSKYPDISFNIKGNYRHFDIAPQERIPLTLSGADNKRNLSFTNKNFLIKAITWNWLADQNYLFPVMALEEDTDGFPATTIVIPTAPPDTGYGGVPPFDFPPFPGIPTLPGLEIDLYDEGELLGPITELDIVGNASTASIPTALFGQIQYINVCNPDDESTLNSNFNNGLAIVAGGSTAAQLFPIASVGTTSGMAIDLATGTCTFYSAGNYKIKYVGTHTPSYVSFPTNQTWNAKIYIDHYNEAGVLQATYTGTGEDAYIYQYTLTQSNGTANFSDTNMSFNITVNRGDYILVRTATDPTYNPTGSDSWNMIGDLSIYRDE